MTIRIVRLGSPRMQDEGLRIGTVRRPPRGIRKEAFAARDFYDLWFPNLAPSATLLKSFVPDDEQSWQQFQRKFLAEMKTSGARHDLNLLAAFSHRINCSVGCYCKDESRCHRSLLRRLLVELGADVCQ